MMDRHSAALSWQAGLALYMQMVSWVPLGGWNYQPCCPTGLDQFRRGTLDASETLGLVAVLVPGLVFWWGARRSRRWAMWLALVSYVVWLGLQLWTWWPPYIVGASEHWSQVYERAFARSTMILPRWGNHLPPDAMHLVLQMLLLGVVASGGLTLLRKTEAKAV